MVKVNSRERCFRIAVPKFLGKTHTTFIVIVLLFSWIVAQKLLPGTVSSFKIGMVFGQQAEGLGWTDTNISSASQGKIWTPVRHRAFRKSERLFVGDRTVNNARPQKHFMATVAFSCQRWAVVTTIFQPSELLLQLRNLSEWCLVVVGDKKTEDSIWRDFLAVASDRTVYLSQHDQEKLPYDLTKYVPWNHFGRKNIGYLYAIHHGAELIWDTDDDNVLKNPYLLNKLAHKIKGNDVPALVNTRHPLWNPYMFYSPQQLSGNPNALVWPRGFPLTHIKDSDSFSTNVINTTTRPGIIQSLADNDPDVDAVYRLTQQLPFSFSKGATMEQTLIIPHGTYTPFNAQATLWTKCSLWGLFLPISVHGRVSDIWRSYIVQRLMHDIGISLSFTSPIVNQFRNVHSYIADLEAEFPLYTQSHGMVKWLSENKLLFNCSFKCTMESLYIQLYEVGLLEIEDVYSVQKWISDLESFGFEFPKLKY